MCRPCYEPHVSKWSRTAAAMPAAHPLPGPQHTAIPLPVRIPRLLSRAEAASPAAPAHRCRTPHRAAPGAASGRPTNSAGEPSRRGLPAQYASCALSAGTRSTEPWLMDLPKYSCGGRKQQRQQWTAAVKCQQRVLRRQGCCCLNAHAREHLVHCAADVQPACSAGCDGDGSCAGQTALPQQAASCVNGVE